MSKIIVIDARMVHDSGIGTYIKNIIPFLLKNFEVVLLGNVEKLSIFKSSGRFKVIPFNAKIYSIKEQLLLPFLIPKCDIFWSPHFNSPMFALKAKKRITTIHDVNHLAFNSGMSKIKKMYAKRLYLNAVNKSNFIITVSEFSKQEIVKYLHVDATKIKVVFGGVKDVFFEPSNTSSTLDLPNKYILFVGNIKPHKNLITLLKAYAKFSKSFRAEYKLVILGKKEGFITPDREAFKFIEDNHLEDNVVFTGYLEDALIPQIYKKAALFVFPSLYEGFGLPLLEAMASKTVVLSSNKTSLPEVGLDNVLYFNPLDIDELQKVILRIIEDTALQELQIKKAYKYSKSFSWKKSADSHITLFKEVLNL